MDFRDMNEYQVLLNKISGVISSKIIADETSKIIEIHILASSNRGAKQISRDIQSALLAQFNLNIDHKIISIAQIKDNSLISSPSRLSIKNINIIGENGKIEVKIYLTKDGQDYIGTALGGNSLISRNRIIAEATLDAIHNFLNLEYTFILIDTVRFAVAERYAYAVAVLHRSDTNQEHLIGSAIIKNDDSEAIVRATLDAINRRLIKL